MIEAHEAALREAYARGRRDERARHRNSPLIAAAFGLAGLLGVAVLASTILLGGSLEYGGRLIDDQIAATTQDSQDAARTRAVFSGKLDAG